MGGLLLGLACGTKRKSKVRRKHNNQTSHLCMPSHSLYNKILIK